MLIPDAIHDVVVDYCVVRSVVFRQPQDHIITKAFDMRGNRLIQEITFYTYEEYEKFLQDLISDSESFSVNESQET